MIVRYGDLDRGDFFNLYFPKDGEEDFIYMKLSDDGYGGNYVCLNTGKEYYAVVDKLIISVNKEDVLK